MKGKEKKKKKKNEDINKEESECKCDSPSMTSDWTSAIIISGCTRSKFKSLDSQSTIWIDVNLGSIKKKKKNRKKKRKGQRSADRRYKTQMKKNTTKNWIFHQTSFDSLLTASAFSESVSWFPSSRIYRQTRNEENSSCREYEYECINMYINMTDWVTDWPSWLYLRARAETFPPHFSL